MSKARREGKGYFLQREPQTKTGRKEFHVVYLLWLKPRAEVMM